MANCNSIPETQDEYREVLGEYYQEVGIESCGHPCMCPDAQCEYRPDWGPADDGWADRIKEPCPECQEVPEEEMWDTGYVHHVARHSKKCSNAGRLTLMPRNEAERGDLEGAGWSSMELRFR